VKWLRRCLLCILLLGAGIGCAREDPPYLPGPFTLEVDSLRVVYWGESSAAAQRTLSAAIAPLPLPGIPTSYRLGQSTIILAPNPAIFDSLTFGRTPHWAAGVAIPAQRTIILPVYRAHGQVRDPVVTLRHELAHLALNDYLGAAVPRWFDEGYATWVSGGWDASSGWQIRLAFLRGDAPALDSLTLAWPRSEAGARLAYLLSASAVRHLATSRGEPAFRAFLATWRDGGTFDSAMRSVYQMTPTYFEREWRGVVRRRYGWLLAFTQIAVFWFALAVLVIVLGSARRRHNRQRLEELRREEYMLPPAGGSVDTGYSEE
jgi:hypothetical protein